MQGLTHLGFMLLDSYVARNNGKLVLFDNIIFSCVYFRGSCEAFMHTETDESFMLHNL